MELYGIGGHERKFFLIRAFGRGGRWHVGEKDGNLVARTLD